MGFNVSQRETTRECCGEGRGGEVVGFAFPRGSWPGRMTWRSKLEGREASQNSQLSNFCFVPAWNVPSPVRNTLYW
jgi:hypothetical protein